MIIFAPEIAQTRRVILREAKKYRASPKIAAPTSIKAQMTALQISKADNTASGPRLRLTVAFEGLIVSAQADRSRAFGDFAAGFNFRHCSRLQVFGADVVEQFVAAIDQSLLLARLNTA